MEHIMSKKVSPIPRGYRTATTCLTVYDVDAALAFYQAAFGAETLTRFTVAEELPASHATIKIGNSIIALNMEAPEQGIFAPMSLGASVGQIHLYVDDVNASWERAIEAGAMVHTPIYEAFWGDRTGILQDGNGHLWSIASKIENVSQDEITRRAQAGIEVAAAPIWDEFPVEAFIPEEVLADTTVAA
jgi:PhnB protein